jgi:hypothetical protein
MQRLEISRAVLPLKWPLDIKWLKDSNELNVLICDALITSAEGTALTATSSTNNIIFEVQTSQMQPSKVPSFGVVTSELLSVLQVFWYTAP